MGDHFTETLELQSRRDDEEYARDHIIGGHHLRLHEDTISWISSRTDCFIRQSRGNESVEYLFLYPYAFNGHDDDICDKGGQAVGNLQALKTLCIPYHDNEVLPPPVRWEILARILRHMRQSVSVVIDDDDDERSTEEVQPFARAIRGHPTITSFCDYGRFPYESLDTLFSTLTTLPTLESISLSNSELRTRTEDESTLAYPESLTELLRAPTLRSVCFHRFSFTPALCQAAANALMEGTAITKLEFDMCSFSAVECAAIMATGLSRNTSVTSIIVWCHNARAFFDALAAALPSNSTLRHLELLRHDNDAFDLSPVFLSLGKNTGLKTLNVSHCYSMDESLSTAMKDGLGVNTTLESLEVDFISLCDANAALWCRAFSFLRTNKALKSLIVHLKAGATDSCVSTLRSDIACMLQENTSLESIAFQSGNTITIKAEEYFVLVTALQHNATLKSLKFHHNLTIWFNDDESEQIASLLQKNYALESLPGISLKKRARDVGAILRLNAAGRRYLIEDGSSISKGVEVLSKVNTDINCVFLHLLENPRPCDRHAVELVRAGCWVDESGS
jgi:hypothetical protein